MAAITDVDIVNDALGHIGVKKRIQALSDSGVPVQEASAAYAFCLKEMLERRRWSWAEKRVALTASAADTAPTGWFYVYSAPSDMVAPREFWSGQVVDTPDVQRLYEMIHGANGTVFLTNEPAPELVYTMLVEQTARFPPLFAKALSWKMAERLAPSLAESLQWWKLAAQNAVQAESEAWARDINGSRHRGEQPLPTSIRKRW